MALLVSACAREADDGSSLLDMYGEGEGTTQTEADASAEEVPFSEGPSEIPDDLVLPE